MVMLRPAGTSRPVTTLVAVLAPLLVTVTMMVPLALGARVLGAVMVTDRSARAGPVLVTVSMKLAPTVPDTPGVVAGMTADPAVLPTSGVGAVATPLALVVAVVAVTLVPELPKSAVPVLDGLTANVTTAPATGLPEASVTFTDNGVANAWPVFADWSLPVSMVTVAGLPAVTTSVALSLEAVNPAVPL